jgi:ABC-type transporter Mla MlaB component
MLFPFVLETTSKYFPPVPVMSLKLFHPFTPPFGEFFFSFNKFRLLEERENTVREERKKEMEVTVIDSVDPSVFSVRLNTKKLGNLPRRNTLITGTPNELVRLSHLYFLEIIGKCCTFTVYRRWSSPTWSGCQSFLKTKWNLGWQTTSNHPLERQSTYYLTVDVRKGTSNSK